ncbi:hypothetical protein MMC27_005216 [Xylographa pallens]|nr:hypothetical protein [Xylographa pallens]
MSGYVYESDSDVVDRRGLKSRRLSTREPREQSAEDLPPSRQLKTEDMNRRGALIDLQDPLPERLVPSIKNNSFLRTAAMHKLRLEDDIATEDDQEFIVAELETVLNETNRGAFAPRPITTARDIKVFESTTESSHDDRYFFLASLLIINRYHYLSDENIARFILPKRWFAKDALRQIHTEKLRKQQTVYQNHVIKNFITGFNDLISMTGRDRWDVSTPEQREKFYELLYKSGPFAMISMSVGRAAIILPLPDLFSDMTSDLHSLWRTFYKTMLMWSLEAVWEHVIKPKDESSAAMSKLYQKWKQMPSHDLIENLGLGGVEEIPVKISGIQDTKNRPDVPKFRDTTVKLFKA